MNTVELRINKCLVEMNIDINKIELTNCKKYTITKFEEDILTHKEFKLLRCTVDNIKNKRGRLNIYKYNMTPRDKLINVPKDKIKDYCTNEYSAEIYYIENKSNKPIMIVIKQNEFKINKDILNNFCIFA